MPSRSICFAENGKFQFFLQLSKTPLCIYATFSSIHLLDGLSICFHILATVATATMTTGVHVSKISVFPEVRLIYNIMCQFQVYIQDPMFL